MQLLPGVEEEEPEDDEQAQPACSHFAGLLDQEVMLVRFVRLVAMALD